MGHTKSIGTLQEAAYWGHTSLISHEKYFIILNYPDSEPDSSSLSFRMNYCKYGRQRDYVHQTLSSMEKNGI